MFFELSKVLAFFIAPSNAIVMLAVLGLALTLTRRRRMGLSLAFVGVALVAVAGLSPLGNALLLPLEERFPPWDASRGAPDGIVVLGGAVGPGMSDARNEISLNEAAERMTVVADLARKFPQARIIFSGGDASLFGDRPAEAQFAGRLFGTFGIGNRVELEEGARNTHENAVLSRRMAGPKPGERWLLVTSAGHMPRAIGCFRKADFPVEAYPVDYRTGGTGDLFAWFGTVSAGLARTDVAVREWIGLVAYWLSGRTSELFPAP